MVTLGMAPFGQVIDVGGVAMFNIAGSTKQLKVSNRLHAMVTCRRTTGSDFGVTGLGEMEP